MTDKGFLENEPDIIIGEVISENEPDIIIGEVISENEPDIIAEESPSRGSSVCAFLKKWVISPISKYRHIKNPKISAVLYILGLICTFLFPLYMNFAMEYIYRGSLVACGEYIKAYTSAALFSALILCWIYTILWLICKKGFVASLIFALLCSALAMANHFKHSLTGEFVYPWDLINQTGNLGELTDFVKMGFPLRYVFVLSVGFMFPVAFFFLKSEIPLKILPRGVLSVLVALSLIFSFNSSDKITGFLKTFNMALNATANQENNHYVNGFSGGFILNCLSMSVPEPENYSEETVNEILSKYPSKEKAEDFSSPDVILILSESFWDPRKIPGTTFSENPLANYDEITSRENAISGNMYQTAFGGGTVLTEFEILTGLTVDALPMGAVPWQYIKEPIPTYVSNYKDMGYKTIFMHTYGSSFYMRKQSYQNLGFDELYFDEDLIKIQDVSATMSGRYLSDDSFMDYIMYFLGRGDEPCFIFGISMENHQPYENKYDVTLIDVENPKLSQEAIFPLTNYTTGVYNADKALKKLTDFIDNREKDTILVYFGDHLPTLGADKLALKESGYISSKEMTDSDYQNILNTPFLIYSNFPLKESSMVQRGTNNNISTYNLLNAAADLTGAKKTSLMEFLKAYNAQLPYYNARLKITPNKKQQYFVENHLLLTYDIVSGEKYMTK